MTDKELLEMAARAARIDLSQWNDVNGDRDFSYWNPLTDDGDAFRLAVKLELIVEQLDGWAQVATIGYEVCEAEEHKGDPYAATRRAIVRAAAETGRGME